MTDKPEEKNNSENEIDSLKEELKDLKKKKELEKLQSEVNSLKNNNEKVGAQSDQSQADINSKKTTAGLLGLFFGAFGAHKFVLGYQREGFIYLGVSIVGGIITCGGALAVTSIIALIESIMILTKTQEEFKRKYVDMKTPWF